MKKIFLILLILLFTSTCWGGVDFDGADDGIGCGSDASIDDLEAGQMTIYALIKIDTIDATTRRIISKQSTASGNLTGWSFFFFDNAGTDELQFTVAYDNTNGIWIWQDDLSTGVWLTLVLTYDGSNVANDPKLYINGSLKTIDTETNPIGNRRSSAAYDLDIGNFDNLERPFNGIIAETALGNTIPNSQGIANLSNSKLRYMLIQVLGANLKGYWTLDDHPEGTAGDGLTFRDRSGNGNDGTGDDGANNTGLTCKAEEFLNYPPQAGFWQ